MFTPLRSVGSDDEGPPKRSEVDSNPLPVPLGAGGGVGRAALGVGADEDDLDGGALTISGTSREGTLMTCGSTSMAPSIVEAGSCFDKFGGEGCG
jgi:hypothetical protein